LTALTEVFWPASDPIPAVITPIPAVITRESG
jgi:hypothetical protein